VDYLRQRETACVLGRISIVIPAVNDTNPNVHFKVTYNQELLIEVQILFAMINLHTRNLLCNLSH